MAMEMKVRSVPQSPVQNSVPQSSTVNINAENHVPFTQDRFLSNTENKSGLIPFLSLRLKRRGVIVINCSSDADATIVINALRYAKGNSGAVIVATDDTDAAVMLVYHWEVAMQDIYFFEQR